MSPKVAFGLSLFLFSCGDGEGAPPDPPGTECPPEDVLCVTHGYAHFTISNVAGSGLPNEVEYDTTGGLVRDLVTGLVWQPGPSSEPMGWADAKTHCAALEVDGRSDFRLPTRIELVTILDFGEIPVVASVFEGVASDYHFTASPASFVEGSAYSVYFGAGETTIGGADPGRARALCVAATAAPVSTPQFEPSGDVVLDTRTGLEWEKTPGAPTTLADAESRCAALDMRLPSIRELQSIVDEKKFEPALDTSLFDPGELDLYWSSTLRGADPWHVDFKDGQTYADRFEDELLATRCTRSGG